MIFNTNLHDFLIELILIIPAVAIALSAHEFAHAFVAYKMGDTSQLTRGRLSLNPLKHMDLFGTLCLIIFGFGWAKPVQIDASNFKDEKTGMIYSALAGPLMNFFLAFITLFIYCLFYRFELVLLDSYLIYYLCSFLEVLALINIGLGLFNIIPVPPLDGSKIIGGLLSDNLYHKMLHYERYISIALIVLLTSGVFDSFLYESRNLIYNGMLDIFIKLLGL